MQLYLSSLLCLSSLSFVRFRCSLAVCIICGMHTHDMCVSFIKKNSFFVSTSQSSCCCCLFSGHKYVAIGDEKPKTSSIFNPVSIQHEYVYVCGGGGCCCRCWRCSLNMLYCKSRLCQLKKRKCVVQSILTCIADPTLLMTDHLFTVHSLFLHPSISRFACSFSFPFSRWFLSLYLSLHSSVLFSLYTSFVVRLCVYAFFLLLFLISFCFFLIFFGRFFSVSFFPFKFVYYAVLDACIVNTRADWQHMRISPH